MKLYFYLFVCNGTNIKEGTIDHQMIDQKKIFDLVDRQFERVNVVTFVSGTWSIKTGSLERCVVYESNMMLIVFRFVAGLIPYAPLMGPYWKMDPSLPPEIRFRLDAIHSAECFPDGRCFIDIQEPERSYHVILFPPGVHQLTPSSITR